MKIKLDSEPVYGDNDENIKKNIEMYAGNANTNSQSKGVPKMHHANVYHYQWQIILLKRRKGIILKDWEMQIWTKKRWKWRTLSTMI